MARETVAAVIMTKNSQALVEGTLKSVASWVDEIVVVDGFSTDRTLDICRRYTDKIVQNRWDGWRFSTERNLGTSLATTDWCLHIDPDERATVDFKKTVLRILENGSPHSAFEFRKKNFFLGHWMRWGGWFHYSRHLFRRGRGVYEGIIHERLNIDGSVGRLEACIEHYPFESFRQFVTRHNGYSSREAGALLETHGRLGRDRLERELTQKPLRRFIKFYIKKAAFLDGVHGLVFSILYAWVHFINWAKYWELLNEPQGTPSLQKREPAATAAVTTHGVSRSHPREIDFEDSHC